MTGPLRWIFYRGNKFFLEASNFLIGMIFDPARDIILVTGGASGLGKELAVLFRSKGATVIVFDLKIPDNETEDYVDGVNYYRCDVSNSEEVHNAAADVKSNIGIVTVLINNAGITTGENVLDLSFEMIESTIEVNLLSSFYTIKTFLPDMLDLKRGYIVTVGSTLGYMSPARLSAYGASKSGLIALHESLTYELGNPAFNTSGVKTLLICPGQLKTHMFEGVKTPSTLFAPELEPKYVAKQILKSITYGYCGEIKMPFYGNFLPLLRSVPWPLVAILRYFSGIDRSMKQFVGKAKQMKNNSAVYLSEKASLMSQIFGSKSGNINKIE
jgi:short-subunit dehydrogenase